MYLHLKHVLPTKRLKQENEHLLRLVEANQIEMDNREMEIKRELIADHDERMLRNEAIWNKRLEHKSQSYKTDLDYQVSANH